MSTPSKGAMCAAVEVTPVDVTPPIHKWAARIIDNHTNAIADELAVAMQAARNRLDPSHTLHDREYVACFIIEAALARYQQIKARETP